MSFTLEYTGDYVGDNKERIVEHMNWNLKRSYFPPMLVYTHVPQDTWLDTYDTTIRQITQMNITKAKLHDIKIRVCNTMFLVVIATICLTLFLFRILMHYIFLKILGLQDFFWFFEILSGVEPSTFYCRGISLLFCVFILCLGWNFYKLRTDGLFIILEHQTREWNNFVRNQNELYMSHGIQVRALEDLGYIGCEGGGLSFEAVCVPSKQSQEQPQQQQQHLNHTQEHTEESRVSGSSNNDTMMMIPLDIDEILHTV